jgi:hypothetical protein
VEVSAALDRPRRAQPGEPSEEQLRLAWNLYFRGRRGCPDTLQATLAHRDFGRCLRAAASLTHSGSTFPACHLGAAAAAASRLGHERYVTPTPELPRSANRAGPTPLGRWPSPAETQRAAAHLHRPSRIGAHDAKRAAANDRDDDRDDDRSATA